MTNETNENIDSTNEEEVVEVEEVEAPEVEEEDAEEEVDYKAQVEALEKENKTLKIQKAKAKEKVASAPAPIDSNLKPEDLYALMASNVAKEDITEVQDYAKLKGISIEDALNTGVVKTILAEKTEERSVANATNTGATKRSNKELPEDALLKNAQKGKYPESDTDIERLVNARLESKRQRS